MWRECAKRLRGKIEVRKRLVSGAHVNEGSSQQWTMGNGQSHADGKAEQKLWILVKGKGKSQVVKDSELDFANAKQTGHEHCTC